MWGNFMNIFFDGTLKETSKRQVENDACPDVIEKTDTKYKRDIEALQAKYGDSFLTGFCIEITLRELLEICPRERKRTDAYHGLVSSLSKELGITLIIKSKKTKL